MPTIYSSLYTNFIRQGSTFAKSITTHGYAQSVVAATHPHILNSQNRPVFGRRNTNRLGRFSGLQLTSAFHSNERPTTSALAADHRHVNNHGGLDAYFEALQHKEEHGEVDNEWTQFEFPKRIEWKPDAAAVLTTEEPAVVAQDAAAQPEVETEAKSSISAEDQAALAHINAALEAEIESRRQQELAENASVSGLSAPAPYSAALTPALE